MLKPLPGSGERRRSVGLALLAFLAAASILYPSVRPAYADVSVGAGAGDFLQFEIGGRSAGMAGAHVGAASGVTAQFWNPAGLASLSRPQVGGMHAAWLGDLKYEWIGYARPVSPSLGVASVSVAYFHMPSIAGLDEFGASTGEFKVSDMAVTVGLARELGGRVSVGANAKMIRQSLATVSATGAAFDLGASVRLAGASVGAVVQNLGPELAFDGTSYPLSRQLRFGGSREIVGGRILLAADYNMPSDYFHDARFGAEFRAHPNVSLRTGYKKEFGTVDPADGFSYGLGIQFKQLNLDYAMTPDSDFDDVHRLSFGYSFGAGGSEKPETPKPEEPKDAPEPEAPKGPRVIAQGSTQEGTAPPRVEEQAPKAASTSAPAKSSASTAGTAPAPTAETKPAATPEKAVATAPAAVKSEKAPAVATAPEPAPEVKDEYLVVLPGYPSKESAQAEMKALVLLGFKTKNAQIEKDPKRSGWRISFSKLKSKGSAEDMVSDLQRMSFRARVEVAQR
jgi:hypothetical protein